MVRTVIRIIVGAITLAVWSFVCFSLQGGLGPRVDSRAHEESGRLMAQQALALLEPGGQIAIIARDTGTFANPASDIQLASFRKVIEKARVTVSSVRALKVDPLRPIAVPSSDFCEVIRNTPEGSVIVSFMGPPALTAAERASLGEVKPAIVAFCSGRLPELPDLRALFDQGLLQAAVVDCRGGGEAALAPANQRPDTERSFLILTATNLADLPARKGSER